MDPVLTVSGPARKQVSHTDPATLGATSRELVQRWRERGVLFSSPAKHNDDWYWLYAALASGEACKAATRAPRVRRAYLTPSPSVACLQRNLHSLAVPKYAGLASASVARAPCLVYR